MRLVVVSQIKQESLETVVEETGSKPRGLLGTVKDRHRILLVDHPLPKCLTVYTCESDSKFHLLSYSLNLLSPHPGPVMRWYIILFLLFQALFRGNWYHNNLKKRDWMNEYIDLSLSLCDCLTLFDSFPASHLPNYLSASLVKPPCLLSL